MFCFFFFFPLVISYFVSFFIFSSLFSLCLSFMFFLAFSVWICEFHINFFIYFFLLEKLKKERRRPHPASRRPDEVGDAGRACPCQDGLLCGFACGRILRVDPSGCVGASLCWRLCACTREL